MFLADYAVCSVPGGDGVRGAVISFADITERKRAEQRRTMQGAIQEALSESVSPEVVLERFLEVSSKSLGWDAGAYWTVDAQATELRCSTRWAIPQSDVAELVGTLTRQPVTQGQGLAGQVWEQGRPLSVHDLAYEPDRIPASCQKVQALQGRFASPIHASGALVGVVELFSRAPRPLDLDLILQMTVAGSQLGQFLERQQAAEAVRVSEARTGAVVDAALDCIVTMDSLGRIVEFNPAAERTFGYTRPDVLGRQLAEVMIPPRLREAHRQGLKHLLATGEGPVLNARVELPAQRADGTEIPIELTVTTLPTSGPPLYTGFVRDITERKHSEAALAEQVQLSNLGADIAAALTQMDGLPEMLDHCARAIVQRLEATFARVWVLNARSGILELQASAGLYTHLDGAHSRVELGKLKIGRIAQAREPFLTNDVLHDIPGVDAEWAQREGLVAFAGYPLVVDDRILGVMAMFSRHPLTDTTLKAMGSVANGIALGIERKQVQDSVRTSQQWLATTLRSIGEGVIATSPKGLITFMNPVAEQVTGWRESDGVGRPLAAVLSLVNEATRAPMPDPMLEILSAKSVLVLADRTLLVYPHAVRSADRNQWRTHGRHTEQLARCGGRFPRYFRAPPRRSGARAPE
jgi:PAS domain S-box-containing protein